MIVHLFPPLDGEAAERFRAFATDLADAQRAGSKEAMVSVLGREVEWCRSAPHVGKAAFAYEACVRVLTDLARLRWRIVEQGYGFALENPKELVTGRPTEEVIASKEALRSELRPVVDEQQRHPAVMGFISKMEGEDRFGRRSVRLLMAQGDELALRLAPARTLAGDARNSALREAIKPYLQKADETVDRTTGRRLRDIWRYFRYSWSIPQVSTPGRQLLYLVRDAAHEAHPVIGIAALNNCPLEMGEKREAYIGWHLSALVDRFSSAAALGRQALIAEVEWLEQHLRRHFVREVALRERPEAGAERLIVAALKCHARMATEVDMLESVECVLSVDLTDPPPERAQHGSTARALTFAIAQEEAVEVLVVAHLVSADLRGHLT